MPLPLLCKPVTPVKSNRLKFYLTDYDPTLKRYLLDGFLEGFNVHCLTKPSHLDSKNLKSAFENPTAVALKLGKELEAGRLAGPFTKPPFPNFCTSPLGIVPKKAPGEFRLIHHLSYPHGSSVNDGIPKELSSVQYATINHAIQHIRTFGPGCWMAKTDIKSAFRIIPVHPTDFHLLGMKWQGEYYYDRCLPMGCSTSCSIFESFSTALEWIARRYLNSQAVIHILDDFLFVAGSETRCDAQ